MALALQLEDGPLRELDLSHNYSIEAGVKVLSAGLKSPHCHVETLRSLPFPLLCKHLLTSLKFNYHIVLIQVGPVSFWPGQLYGAGLCDPEDLTSSTRARSQRQ